MTDIQIDPTSGDFAVVNNDLVLIAGADEVTQRLRARLRTIMGEWFLDPSLGLDYRGIVWVKGTPQSAIDAAIKREILIVPGVLELQAYDSTLDTAARRLTVNFTVRVTDGAIVEINEVLI